MAKLRLVLRPSARHDLTGIIQYIAENADVLTASRYKLRLTHRCEKLLHATGMGKPYDRRQGIRKINEGPYKIYYRFTDSEVVIMRIWDGRRGREPFLPR